MKLRNKLNPNKFGEIGLYDNKGNVGIAVKTDEGIVWYYHSLAELNEEWCDYEEPKDFWFIDPEILIACESTDPLLCDKKVAIETMKQIGNYFDSREEAEKAVEKLKAWKRLTDKGFKFDNFVRDAIYFNLDEEQIQNKSVLKDLDLLFEGEE